MFDVLKTSKKVIAIIGGGPAASATALSLLKGLDKADAGYAVHIFDAAHQADIRVGESIPPAATPVLMRLGLSHVLDEGHMCCPGSMSLWNDDQPGYNDFMMDASGRGYHLNRAKFDKQLLAEAYCKGVTIHQGWRLTGAAGSEHGSRLVFSTADKGEQMVQADFVVDATGKPAAFARRMNVARNTLDEVVFLCALFDIAGEEDIPAHTLVEAVPEGWWYAARLPEGKMIVTFCTDADVMKQGRLQQFDKWQTLLRNTKWLQEKLPAGVLTAASDKIEIHIQSAPSAILSAVCGPNWLAVGDAASSYDPITSAGITKALMQAEQAGSAITAHVVGNDTEALQAYQARVFEDFNAYVKLRHQLYGGESRFADATFWRRRLGKF